MNMQMAENIFNFLKQCTQTEESKILFILMIIAFVMIVDFITGTIAAVVNPNIEFKSKAGINGILRKIGSMLALIIFIPISVVIPNGAGTALVYTLYIGYLMLELRSIVENLNKSGTDIKIFANILDKWGGK